MLGTIGDAGTYSFNIFKTITAGDGGMVATSDEAAYKRFFGFHDQGHSPNRMGVEVGNRAFVGLDFRMTELTAAVLLAQLRKLDIIRGRLHANKGRFKAAIADVEGVEFRELPDPAGECATLLTVFLPTEEIARKVAGDLGNKRHRRFRLARLLEHGANPGEAHHHQRGLSLHLPLLQGAEPKYWKGMLPQTDALVSRAINISIGVSDGGLGFGLWRHHERWLP